MSFRPTATFAAFFLFGLVSVVRAQVPVQTSTPATVPLPDNEFYCLRESAAAGEAKAQFACGNHCFRARYVTHDYAQALTWCRKSAARGFAHAQNQARQHV